MISDGTNDGFYSYGSTWEHSIPEDRSSSTHHFYLIGKGSYRLAERRNLEKNLLPRECEIIKVRAHIKK